MHVRAHKHEKRKRSKRRDSRFVFQFVRAVGEKLFSERLFSKLGCLREAVLEKPFSAKPFYASQPIVFAEVVLQEEVLRAPAPKALLPLSPHVLRTKKRRLDPTGDRRSFEIFVQSEFAIN